MRGLPGCEAPGIVTPFLILADQIGERIRPPERGDGTLGIERAQQDTVDRPVLVDPALGDRVLVAVFGRRGERDTVVVEEIALRHVDTGQAEVDAIQLRSHAAQRVAGGSEPQQAGHGRLVAHEDFLAQEIIGHGIRSDLAAQCREFAGSPGKPLFLTRQNGILPQLVHQIAIGIPLVVGDIIPRLGERIGQHAVETLQGIVAVVNLARLGLGLRRGIGLGQFADRPVVGEIAVHIVHGVQLHPLRPAQGRIIGLGQLLAEIGVENQVAHLERVGDRPCGTFRDRLRRLLRRPVQVGEHPLLLDGVDLVDQAPLSIAHLEYPAFELQDLLRIALPVRGVFAQLLPGAFHGIDDRVLADLQLRILFQKRHVLPVALEPRDTGFHANLLRTEVSRRQQRRT